MKKFLVKILCKLELWRLAHAISPGLTWYYKFLRVKCLFGVDLAKKKDFTVQNDPKKDGKRAHYVFVDESEETEEAVEE